MNLILTKIVMKKFSLLIGTIAAVALLGAGCAQEPAASEQGAATNTNANANTPAFGGDQTNSDGSHAPEAAGLKDFPAITPLATPIDDSTWKTTMTKAGITITTQGKGGGAPTTWAYSILDNNDPHLQGDCYVTADTVYKNTTDNHYKYSCQTTTELNAGPSERTDYFVFRVMSTDKKGKETTQTNLVTFTKKYPANFDMNAYSASLEHIIGLIK
jgi:hypothetical protein